MFRTTFRRAAAVSFACAAVSLPTAYAHTPEAENVSYELFDVNGVLTDHQESEVRQRVQDQTTELVNRTDVDTVDVVIFEAYNGSDLAEQVRQWDQAHGYGIGSDESWAPGHLVIAAAASGEDTVTIMGCDVQTCGTEQGRTGQIVRENSTLYGVLTGTDSPAPVPARSLVNVFSVLAALGLVGIAVFIGYLASSRDFHTSPRWNEKTPDSL